jgi:hypothetical protein
VEYTQLAEPSTLAAILKWLGRFVGITDRPNVILGKKLETVALHNDPREGYDHWWHLRVENQQRKGLRCRWLRTKDASCRANIKFVSISGTHIFEDAGVGLMGATEAPRELFTLERNRETWIPVYQHCVRKSTPHPLFGPEVILSRDTYATGARYIGQPALLNQSRLPEGRYRVYVTVSLAGDEVARREFTLTVPPNSRGNDPMPEATHELCS